MPFTIGTNDIPKGGLRAIPQFYLIQAFAILLLIFPCANVGMLVLARTAARSGELAVRTALGASRTRVVLQLFVESLVPAVAAAGSAPGGPVAGATTVDPAESDRLLDVLYRQALIPEYQCRFHWHPGSVAFWDNRAVQHYAVNDYWPDWRVMERVTVIGERPV